jgi:uncharacterized protein (TIGR00730 family)
MKSIVVFCGSSSGTDTVYQEQAIRLGRVLAQQGIALVYGGACVGLMGAVADGVLQHGGKVTGVIPVFLKTKEIAHNGLTELIEVQSMHERKMKMHELSEGIIALPGGFGTFEELFEMLTWGQLGLHKKPIGLLNVNGFYTDLVQMVAKMTEQGFLKEVYREMLIVADDIETLLEKMNRYVAPEVGKWITKEKV